MNTASAHKGKKKAEKRSTLEHTKKGWKQRLKIANPGLLMTGAEAGTVEEQSKEVIKELLFSSDEGSIANDEKKNRKGLG